MDRIKQLRERLENVDIFSQVVEVARRQDIRARLIKANQDRLVKGLKTDGKRILPNYSEGYKRKRNRMGLQTGYVDLKVSGATYESIDYFVKKDSILFFSRTPYSEFLENRYATKESHIYGLTDDELGIIKTEIITSIRKQIGL